MSLPEPVISHDEVGFQQPAFSLDPWNDKRTFKLFLAGENEHPKDAIARRIDILMDARIEPEGYKLIVLGGDESKSCTTLDIIKLNDQCIYLISALTTALNEYPSKTWMQCCMDASKTCSIFTNQYCCQTIADWWAIFKVNNAFPHPCGIEVNSDKKKGLLPPILRDNEDLRRKFVRFCTHNLTDLNIDVAREYIIGTLLPEAFPLTISDDNHQESRKDALRRIYMMSETPSRSTVWEWLKHCGFRYKPRTKRFFVDTHESLPNQKYRKDQMARYLKRERLMNRWYQLSLEEALAFEKEGLLLPGKGFRYKNEQGLEMVEIHMDEITDNKLLTEINSKLKYSGNLSICKQPDEKLLTLFGHNGCIFHQYIFTGKSWSGPKGELAIIPKDEGNGIMISAFQSREFGLG
jgi:hypothetical protein